MARQTRQSSGHFFYSREVQPNRNSYFYSLNPLTIPEGYVFPDNNRRDRKHRYWPPYQARSCRYLICNQLLWRCDNIIKWVRLCNTFPLNYVYGTWMYSYKTLNLLDMLDIHTRIPILWFIKIRWLTFWWKCFLFFVSLLVSLFVCFLFLLFFCDYENINQRLHFDKCFKCIF